MALTRSRAAKRKSKKKKSPTHPALAEMSVEEFMASELLSESEGEEEEGEGEEEWGGESPPKRKKLSHQAQLSRLPEVDPEFFQFLRETDQSLLQFSDSGEGEESEGEENGKSEESEGEDLGQPEPVPQHITSRKQKVVAHSPSTSDDEEEEGGEGGEGEGGEAQGIPVTLAMIHRWVKRVDKTHSLPALRQLTLAMHAAVAGILDRPRGGRKKGGGEEEEEEEEEKMVYRVEGTAEFNALMVACLKHLPPCLSHHIPPHPSSSRRQQLPSSHKQWLRVKRVVKPYLSDLLRLLEGLREPSMQCVVLRHMQTLSAYYVSLPQLQRALVRSLVTQWATGEHHVRVVAFLILRRVTLLLPHPSLHRTLKRFYLAFVRNCKFTTVKSLPEIRFMQNCLVELLAIDPPTAYQHAFVYIRQLAIHLRTAMTSPKKDAVQAVYNWQYVHCLVLWTQFLSTVRHDSLRPLTYPLVQTALGTLSLQPSPQHLPLRLHVVEALLQLARDTDTFIPLAPYLLEILESHGVDVSRHSQGGKPPDLSVMLKATKQQLQSKGFQSVLLNKSFELLLRFFAIHTHCIGFPELTFPALVRIRKVVKATPLSWFRLQLKQLVEKVEEVSREVERERAAVNFSPKDLDKISAWERGRRDRENAVTRFLETWQKVHQQPPSHKEREREDSKPSHKEREREDSKPSHKERKGEDSKPSHKERGSKPKKVTVKPSVQPREEEGERVGEELDIVEDFQFSPSEDSDSS